MTKRAYIGTAVAAAITAIAATAGVTAFATGQELTASTEDLFKPGSEMMFTTSCEELSATLTTSFGAETTMTPAADAGHLIGFVTAPDSIGPGPDDGYHTYTVTCGNQSATFRFSNDTNGAK